MKHDCCNLKAATTNPSPYTHLGYASRELTSAHVQEERGRCREGREGRGEGGKRRGRDQGRGGNELFSADL